MAASYQIGLLVGTTPRARNDVINGFGGSTEAVPANPIHFPDLASNFRRWSGQTLALARLNNANNHLSAFLLSGASDGSRTRIPSSYAFNGYLRRVVRYAGMNIIACSLQAVNQKVHSGTSADITAINLLNE